MAETKSKNKKGRPRAKVNFDTVKALAENGYGCKRIARVITEQGCFISASTINRILNTFKIIEPDRK
jgi:hypothetical protein